MATIGLASAVFTNAPTLGQPYDNIILNEAKLSQTQPLYLTMSYNPRMSMVPNSQQQNRGKKKEEDSDAFMRLVRIHSHTFAAHADYRSRTRRS
jgi:hypothetical protein